ncbi:DUF3293 domain-containing protein [Pseudoalteromonas sp. YIC-656]|uniref:DUF3293 domain-containing protein n=1 Tax=Pseudoalteromonas pernae TaxID=3118054 RepID=UPI003241D056
MHLNTITEVTLDAYLNAYFYLPNLPIRYQSACVITAWNPNGVAVGARKNRQRSRLLVNTHKHRLMSRGYGGNKEMTYREFSVLLKGDRSQALHLMQCYHQKGVYYINKGKIELLLSDGRSFELTGTAKSRVFKRKRLPRLNKAQYFSGFDRPRNA